MYNNLEIPASAITASQYERVKEIIENTFFDSDCNFHEDMDVITLQAWCTDDEIYIENVKEALEQIISIISKDWETAPISWKITFRDEESNLRTVVDIKLGKITIVATPPAGVTLKCPHCKKTFTTK